ncbi:hypothetical protein CRUP_002943 [Coryphaenoides rupestris]|nr:hypothetical protein CRUP_002943 [Coryphaenoides rupestris]
MASESFQYRALFEYKRERGDDIGLQPGDLLTVAKSSMVQASTAAAASGSASAATGLPSYQEGDERSPRGWLHGTNDRTKEKGDFPGTFVEYVGAVVVRAGPPAAAKPRPRTPGGPQAAAGPPQPPGGASASAAGLLRMPAHPLM